ncbi:MAG: zinc transport system permease protein [Actinomycetota bacterium]|nr:zinc transport system permease protein [Actinomycetota bacterium]
MKLPLPWPFDEQYMQLALAAGLVIGVCAPLIGSFLVQKRLSLMGDGIGHLAFAGVAAGALVGVAPLAVALAVSAAGAVAIERLRSRGRASGDLVLALFLYSGVAAGVVLLSRAGSLNTSIAYLFGAILTISPSELWVVVGLGVLIVAVMALMGRALFAVVLDEESARVAGLPVDGLNTALAVLTAVTIVAAMRVVGVLLVAALMVLPVASAQQLSRSFRSTVAWAVAVGAVSVVTGLVVARAWALAAGATIVLVAAAVYALTTALAGRLRRPGRGLEGTGGPRLTSAP